MIDLRAVSKQYGRVEVLREVSFRLEAGRSAALVGPSGSGKTTLLRIVAGLDLPDAGEVWLGGTLASRRGWGLPPHERGIGLVPQAAGLWPHMTVAANVAFGLARLPRAERGRRLAEVLERTGAEPLADRFPGELSGGEARRVALARALAPQPALLLMDEPLTNLDPAARDQLLDLVLATVRSTGCSLLYVTHLSEEARLVGGEVLRLDAGQVAVRR
jgi:iron(III) transport system ATP-binding protein